MDLGPDHAQQLLTEMVTVGRHVTQLRRKSLWETWNFGWLIALLSLPSIKKEYDEYEIASGNILLNQPVNQEWYGIESFCQLFMGQHGFCFILFEWFWYPLVRFLKVCFCIGASSMVAMVN